MVGVGAIVFHGDRVLLVQRGREPAKGQWSLPGGLVEVGETLERAVRREVAEETGLDVRVGNLVTVLDRVILDEKQSVQYHYVLLDFLCHYTDGDLTSGTDAADCRFVPVNDLPKYPLTEGTESVIRRAYTIKDSPLDSTYSPSL
jgi:ADP-ribose pyrophosphatase YjhB (NUDIX family)